MRRYDSGPGAAAVQSSRNQPHGRTLLTIGDAARLLGVTRQGMHWVAEASRLPRQRTLRGQLLFCLADVDALVARRDRQRSRQRHPVLARIRPRMAKAQLRLPLGKRSDGDRSASRSSSTPLEFPKRSRNVA